MRAALPAHFVQLTSKGSADQAQLLFSSAQQPAMVHLDELRQADFSQAAAPDVVDENVLAVAQSC